MTDQTQTAPVTAETSSVARVEFCGTYRHSIDAKGRVAVPAQLRRGLPDGSVVAPGPDRRLRIWPPDAWAIERQVFLRTAETPAQERRLDRILHANAYPLDVDAQGRMLIPARQREWAGIDAGVVFLGLGAAVEVAGDAVWAADEADLDPDEFTRLHDVVHRAGGGTPPGTR